MPDKINYWKISPEHGGAEWNDWMANNYSILYNWTEKPYFDKININLKENYLGPDDFLKNVGYTGGVKHEWRLQLKTFVWDVNEDDIAFAYKKGTFVGCGKFGEYYYDSEKGHIRDISWVELNPPLDLHNTNLIKVLSIPIAGTIKSINDYMDEVQKLMRPYDIIKPEFHHKFELLTHKCQIIFYGPPGTGKTYKAREFAVNFIENYLVE